MGSCISKCIPNSKKLSHHEPKLEDHQQDQYFSHVHDKLVIMSQTPKKAIQNIPLVTNPINKLIASHDPSRTPPSPSASTLSSTSSFVTCTASKSSVGSSSISSSSSSSAPSLNFGKDNKPSFSNDFLWSCYKENPHISLINSLNKETSKYNNNNKPIVSTSTNYKQTCPQKRLRPVSPSPNNSSSITRQKSFRRDHHHHQPELQLYSRDNYNYYSKCSTSLSRSSPSPSRRFVSNNNGEKLDQTSHSKRLVTASPNNNLPPIFARKENLRPCLRSSISAREQRNVHRIGSKIDEIAVAEALARHEIDSVLMEDIDNPLISLDCFIFI